MLGHAFLAAVLLFLIAPVCAKAAPAAGQARTKPVFLKTPNPHTPMEHNNRGVELGSLAIWPDAIREHELALQMDPHNKLWRTNLSAAHLEYGKFLQNKGKTSDAQTELRRALIIDPENGSADQQLDKIISSKKTDPHDPKDYSFRKSLAMAADSKGEFDTAIVEWRKCIAISDSPLDHANLGRTLLKAGKEVEAYNQLREAVGRSGWPDDQKIELSECHRDLAEILKKFSELALKSGHREKAAQRFANAATEYRRAVFLNTADGRAIQGWIDVGLQAVAINPGFDNRLALSNAYVFGGDYPHAKQELSYCKKLNPNNPDLQTAYIYLYGAIVSSQLPLKIDFLKETLEEMKQLLSSDSQNTKLPILIESMQKKIAELETQKNQPLQPLSR